MTRLLFAVGTLFLLIAGTVSQLAAAPPEQTAQDVCFARWEWVTEVDEETGAESSFWQVPFVENNTGLLDLRSLPQAGSPGPIAQGWGLFAYDQPMGSTGMHCMGGDLDARVTAVQADTIALILGKQAGTLQARSMRLLVRELFIQEADPTGQNFTKPVRISRRGGFQIHLGGYGAIVQENFSLEHPALANSLAVRWADYRRNKAAGVPLATLQRWTGFDSLKYFGREPTAEDLERLLPPEHLEDGWRSPETTITESFPTDTLDLGTSVDQDLDWTVVEGAFDVSSGRAREVSGPTFQSGARAESSLSSDDHYSQAEDWNSAVSSNRPAVAARFAAAANTYYYYHHQHDGTESNLLKMIAGTRTSLATAADGVNGGNGQILRIEVDESALEGFFAGVSRVTATDTDITGNLLCGLAGRANGGSRNIFDNFEAADLGVAPPAESQIIIIDTIMPVLISKAWATFIQNSPLFTR